MDRAGLFKNYTMQKVVLLGERDVIGKFEQPGVPVILLGNHKKQKELYAGFGINPPSKIYFDQKSKFHSNRLEKRTFCQHFTIFMSEVFILNN